MEKKRLVYEPPQVRDLSGFGASGQETRGCGVGTQPSGGPGGNDCYFGVLAGGTCSGGYNPMGGGGYVTCQDGSVPGPDQCGNGALPA